MIKVDQDPFSNGTEFDVWDAHNCERCIKNSHLKDNMIDYTKVVCAIQRDILTRMVSNIPIAQRTIDICQMRDCPHRKEEWPKKKKTDRNRNEPKLFEDNA